MASISLPCLGMSMIRSPGSPVQPQVAASARSSVVSTNANRASNGTSRIKRLLTTASLVLQDLSQSFSRMNLASLVIGDAARPPRIVHSFHHRFLCATLAVAAGRAGRVASPGLGGGQEAVLRLNVEFLPTQRLQHNSLRGLAHPPNE